ncbi:hypothetical protein [Pectinatus frisingensis]|uniref:hypothetical protein n=1 Tax=Pectinatus frisingensis TaxID=865 RepID=UPI0018C648DD|nr:hypothetical protein [Pectinatus frisingensis]
MSDKDSIKIKKVKVIDSMQKIKIEYTEIHEDIENEMAGTFNEQAAPEFYKAFEKLKAAVVNILEFDKFKGIEKRITPYGVTFHYSKDGTMGAIISSSLELPDAGTTTVINTPMRKCDPDDGETESLYFTEATAKSLWKLETETRKYLSGKRAQMSLFGANGQPLDASEAEDEPDDEPQQEDDQPDMDIMPPDVAAANIDNVVPIAR